MEANTIRFIITIGIITILIVAWSIYVKRVEKKRKEYEQPYFKNGVFK